MICKRCGHPDYSHHAVTGKCDASIMKVIRKYNDLYCGFPRYCVEAESLGECDCK